MQTYQCRCGYKSNRPEEDEKGRLSDVFLHGYTTHLHVDVGLEPEDSKALVEQCMDYRWEMMSIGVN